MPSSSCKSSLSKTGGMCLSSIVVVITPFTASHHNNRSGLPRRLTAELNEAESKRVRFARSCQSISSVSESSSCFTRAWPLSKPFPPQLAVVEKTYQFA
jgi:hypothetical protein